MEESRVSERVNLSRTASVGTLTNSDGELALEGREGVFWKGSKQSSSVPVTLEHGAWPILLEPTTTKQAVVRRVNRDDDAGGGEDEGPLSPFPAGRSSLEKGGEVARWERARRASYRGMRQG